MRMQDPGLGDAAFGEWPETFPRQMVPLTPPPQRPKPVTQHLPPKRLQRRHVARDGVVVVVTPHHRLQPRDLLHQRIVTTPHQRFLHPMQLRTQPLAHRPPLHAEAPALTLPPTAVGEAQEVEGFRLARATLLPIPGGEPPELDQPRFLRMQVQAELPETLPQFTQEPLGLVAVLKPD